MKTLNEFNKERETQVENNYDNSPRSNGIECPECGCELFDSSPMITLASNPPKKDIMCNGCGYHGYRVA